jgi:hypothetical protein
MTHLQKEIHKTISWRGTKPKHVAQLILSVMSYRSLLIVDYQVARFKDVHNHILKNF